MKGHFYFPYLCALTLLLAACNIAPASTPTPPETIPPTNTSTPLPPTATVTHLATASPTNPSPTATKTTTPSATPDTPIYSMIWNESVSIQVAFLFANTGDIVLVSRNGLPVRTLHFNDFTPLNVSFSTDNCQLLLTPNIDKKIVLLSVDFNGNILQEYFTGGYTSEGGWMTFPALSPSGKWVSYTVWSGEKYYLGAEFQDVFVVSLDVDDTPFRLTERGGAWRGEAAWSPDGKFLAYSDKDINGILQLYISNPDGKDKQQLTHFTNEELAPGPIKWSPNGERLVTGIYDESDNERITSEFWIVSLDGENPVRANLEQGDIIREGAYWWDVKGEALMVYTEKVDRKSRGVYWIDAINGEVLREKYEVDLAPGGNIAYPFPNGNIYNLVSLKRDFYLYNFEDDNVSLWANYDSISPNEINNLSPDIHEISPIIGEPIYPESCVP
jgi:WD40 repeat protein